MLYMAIQPTSILYIMDKEYTNILDMVLQSHISRKLILSLDIERVLSNALYMSLLLLI